MAENSKERPILFSAPMVRAILEGRKTQTRRVVKPRPNRVQIQGGDWLCDDGRILRCPYGLPGDRLWVREAWGYFGGDEYLYQRDPGAVGYGATYDSTHIGKPIPGGKWHSSMFMPRWASRITLKITHVRVERLNEISREDAIAEGIGAWDAMGWPNYLHPERRTSSPVQGYQTLWDSINGRGAFDANPWVWVITFTRQLPEVSP